MSGPVLDALYWIVERLERDELLARVVRQVRIKIGIVFVELNVRRLFIEHLIVLFNN